MRSAALILAVTLITACSSAPPVTATAAPPATASAATTPRLGSVDRPVVLSLSPTSDGARAATSGKAIVAALERATALKWDVRVPTSYASEVEDLCAGTIDVAWLSPLATVSATTKNCADPLLAALRPAATGRAETTYSGQVVVRSDAGLSALKDLKGKRIAYGDRASLAGTLFPMLAVKRETGEDPATFFSQSVFIGGDDKAILAVYQGQVDAGASPVDARDLLEPSFPDVKQRTKRIATTGPIPNDGIAVRRGLTGDVRERIQKALLEYARSDDGKRTLKALYAVEGLDRIDGKLFDPVLEATRVARLDLDRELAATPRPQPSANPRP